MRGSRVRTARGCGAGAGRMHLLRDNCRGQVARTPCAKVALGPHPLKQAVFLLLYLNRRHLYQDTAISLRKRLKD